jgi:hypothetical protein
MFNKNKRWHPKYKIVFLDPFVALHTQQERLDTQGYRFAQCATECEKIKKVIQEKDENTKHILYDNNTGIFSVVVYEGNYLKEYPVGDFWDMQTHLGFKKKMGASFTTNFYVVCIKKNTPNRLVLGILFLNKAFTRLIRKL